MTLEADGDDETEDRLAFDDEPSDGEGDGVGEVAKPSGERDDGVDGDDAE